MDQKKINSEIGYTILLWETMERNRNRMIMYMDKGDIEGMKALLSMQMDNCRDYTSSCREILREVNCSHEKAN